MRFSGSPLPRVLTSALLAVTAIGGCKKTEDPTGATDKVPAAIAVVQGDNQSIQAGKELPTPVILRVLNAAGEPLSGVTVSLVVATGGGAVTPASDTTNIRGEIKAKWTLGVGIEEQSILAMVPGVPPMPVRAVGIVPTTIILVQGNNQSARAGGALTNSIIVRVVGGANVPMQGVAVMFQVTTGGGAIAPQTVITNALGEALTKWTLGSVGINSALVVVGALTPVSLTATATP